MRLIVGLFIFLQWSAWAESADDAFVTRTRRSFANPEFGLGEITELQRVGTLPGNLAWDDNAMPSPPTGVISRELAFAKTKSDLICRLGFGFTPPLMQSQRFKSPRPTAFVECVPEVTAPGPTQPLNVRFATSRDALLARAATRVDDIETMAELYVHRLIQNAFVLELQTFPSRLDSKLLFYFDFDHNPFPPTFSAHAIALVKFQAPGHRPTTTVYDHRIWTYTPGTCAESLEPPPEYAGTEQVLENFLRERRR